MADATDRAVAIVLDAADAAGVFRAIARACLATVEARRGARYSQPYSFKLVDQYGSSARDLVAERFRGLAPRICAEVTVPKEPTKAREAYENARTGYSMAVWRQKIDSSTPGPSKPDALVAYERACERFVSEFHERAAQMGCDLRNAVFQAGLAREIADAAAPSTRLPATHPPRERQRGTHAKPAAFLAGEAPIPWDWDESVPEPVPSRTSVLAAARAKLGVQLVFAEDLACGTTNAAVRARRSEGYRHRDDVATMVGILRRLQYAVYAGDVGIDGVYAMADLVAFDERETFFVECLSKASIKQGVHERKLALAQRVPFWFVGALPDGFVAELPPSAFAIPYVRSPRMSSGEWVPYFWRCDREPVVTIDLRVKRARKLTTITFAIPTLRLPEDVAGFVHTAIWSQRLNEFRQAGWKVTPPRHASIGWVPFERIGLAYSSFRFKSDESELLIRLGRLPLESRSFGVPTLRSTSCARSCAVRDSL